MTVPDDEHATHRVMPTLSSVHTRRSRLLAVAVWAVGLAAFGLAWARLNTLLCDVVTYRLVWRSSAPRLATYLSPVLAVVAVGVLALLRYRSSPDHEDSAIDSASAPRSALSAGLPLVLVVAIAAAWITYLLSPEFVASCLLAVGMGWAIARLGHGVRLPRVCAWVERLAPWLLGAAILLATLWNASMQIHLWRHFRLGYADFGLFITELEHCLPWKDVPTRFLGTRMGNHCIPLLYLLAPLYAVFRTPMFLMVVGPLALNLAAIPFFQLARRRSGSATTGLIVAVAWLALPSLSWLPYSNSYGFQPVYLAPPLLAAAFVWGLQGRWRLSHACLVAAVLAQETISGVAFGWGVYLALFGGRRKTGLLIAAGALGYLALATLVVIPAFSEVGAYTRTELFGHLSFNEVFHRVARPRVPLYLLALTAPFLPWLWRGRRILVVALPALSLILLMENADYLNILYWHHASLLPVLFTAAVIGVVRVEKSLGDSRAESDGATRVGARSWGPALGMLVTVLLLHHLWGFSPLSQGYRVYMADPAANAPDPRLAVVESIRARFPSTTTTVAATQRMAAHFCDYRAVYIVDKLADLDIDLQVDLIILDHSDRWDAAVSADGLSAVRSNAIRRNYSVFEEHGAVMILTRPGFVPPSSSDGHAAQVAPK